MEFTVTEADFERVFSRKVVDAKLRGMGTSTLGQTNEVPEGSEAGLRRQAVLDALPRVLAEKFSKIMPDDWVVNEIVLKVNVAGKPFGVGLEGDATVKFGPKIVPG